MATSSIARVEAVPRRWTIHDGIFFAKHVLSGNGRAPVERELIARAKTTKSRRTGNHSAASPKLAPTAPMAVRSAWLMAGQYPQPVQASEPRKEKSSHGGNLYSSMLAQRRSSGRSVDAIEPGSQPVVVQPVVASEIPVSDPSAPQKYVPSEEVWLAAHEGKIEFVRIWLKAGGDVRGRPSRSTLRIPFPLARSPVPVPHFSPHPLPRPQPDVSRSTPRCFPCCHHRLGMTMVRRSTDLSVCATTACERTRCS